MAAEQEVRSVNRDIVRVDSSAKSLVIVPFLDGITKRLCDINETIWNNREFSIATSRDENIERIILIVPSAFPISPIARATVQVLRRFRPNS